MSPNAFIQAIVPSMFHRRLLLLLVLIVLALTPLSLRLTSLTLGKGLGLREDAERRLVRRAWTPTVRGSILDRRGRVLAQDRPSYDVAVDYSVITGDWVQRQAYLAARHAAGARWGDMSAAQHEDSVARYRPAFVMHLDRGWDELARRLNITREDLDKRRDQVIAEIASKQEHNTLVLLKSELAHQIGLEREEIDEIWKGAGGDTPGGGDSAERFDLLAQRVVTASGEKGRKLDAASLKSIVKHARQPIAEVKLPQVLMARVSDTVGFACRVLADQQVEVLVDDESGRGPGGKELPTGGGSGDGSLLSAASQFSLSADVMPGLLVMDGGDRDYPVETVSVPVDMSTLPSPLRRDGLRNIVVEGLAAHVLGRIRDQVHKEDPQRREEFLRADRETWQAAMGESLSNDSRYDPLKDRGGYRDGDRVGDTGVEASQESVLRGLRGVQTSRLDTGDRVFMQAVRGKDVTLTLDIMLQARVQAAMSPTLGLAVVQEWQRSATQLLPVGAPAIGQPLNGAAVVLDIDSGDILAMVSMPSYTREQARQAPETVYQDPMNVPFLNRAIAKPYPPGSIVKPLILNGAVQRGNFTLDQRIACTGYLFPNQPNMYRCWIYKQHNGMTHSSRYGHDLSGSDAIMASCNIFFFTMGKRLGPEGIIGTYREFGVGDRFNLGVGQEFAGTLGKSSEGSGVGQSDAIQMGIGQGPVSWTPLHAAAAYATLARGGIKIMPRLIVGQPRPEPVDLNLNPAAVAEALDGLNRAVNDHEGTGNHLTIDDHEEPIFNAPGVKIWGKTGTAAASPLMGDPDGEGPRGREILEAGDHSWFVILVGNDRPRYVISVVTDFGGSGGKVSGPIANQIIYALMAEGYL
jgi:cell division protein FtsI/penicillin-binding protein 2